MLGLLGFFKVPRGSKSVNEMHVYFSWVAHLALVSLLFLDQPEESK